MSDEHGTRAELYVEGNPSDIVHQASHNGMRSSDHYSSCYSRHKPQHSIQHIKQSYNSNLHFAVDFQHIESSSLEICHENDPEMEVDETAPDFLDRLICPDKHLWYGDIWRFLHLHSHHLYDSWRMDLDEPDEIVVVLRDLKRKTRHRSGTLLQHSPEYKIK